MAPHIEELRFLRTLTPPPRNPESESDSDSYDPYRSPTPENTTGVEFDPKDEVWRCTHCGWEVETVDGVQGYCRSGHRSDLTCVDGWFSTCEWDIGMWSDQGGEDGSYDGNEGRSEDEWFFFGGPGGCRIVKGWELVGSDDEFEEEEEKEEEDFGWIVEDEDEDEDEEGEGDEGGEEGDDEREDEKMEDAEEVGVGTEGTRLES